VHFPVFLLHVVTSLSSEICHFRSILSNSFSLSYFGFQILQMNYTALISQRYGCNLTTSWIFLQIIDHVLGWWTASSDKLNHFLSFFCHFLFATDVTPLRNSLKTLYFQWHNRGFIVSYFSSSCCGTGDFLILSKPVSPCPRLCDIIHTYHLHSRIDMFYVFWPSMLSSSSNILALPVSWYTTRFTIYYHSLKC
jgi:hypothetical protein